MWLDVGTSPSYRQRKHVTVHLLGIVQNCNGSGLDQTRPLHSCITVLQLIASTFSAERCFRAGRATRLPSRYGIQVTGMPVYKIGQSRPHLKEFTLKTCYSWWHLPKFISLRMSAEKLRCVQFNITTFTFTFVNVNKHFCSLGLDRAYTYTASFEKHNTRCRRASVT